jgi:hypothetical protein
MHAKIRDIFLAGYGDDNGYRLAPYDGFLSAYFDANLPSRATIVTRRGRGSRTSRQAHQEKGTSQ